MSGQPGFFDVEDRLQELSAKGDSLEQLNAVVDFEVFRADLERAVPRSDRAKGGRPPFDHVLMFKTLVLQASHSLSDERTEYLIRDRLSFMRFLGLGLADTVPDANTIWNFREALTRARIVGKPAIEVLFERFDEALSAAGFLAMSGQLIDASIVAAPKQRNTNDEKRDIKDGRIPAAWADKPAKLRQKDRDARWTVKYTKAKPGEEGGPRIDLAIPAFGYNYYLPRIAGRPLTGARIETIIAGVNFDRVEVAPSRGRGSKRRSLNLESRQRWSPPHGGADRNSACGPHTPHAWTSPRNVSFADQAAKATSRPLTGARIETRRNVAHIRSPRGRPLTGARIETARLRASRDRWAVAPSRGRGSKP